MIAICDIQQYAMGDKIYTDYPYKFENLKCLFFKVGLMFLPN